MANPDITFSSQGRASRLFPFHLVEVDDSIHSWKKDWRGIIGEFVGTLLFTFASACIAMISSQISGYPNFSLGSILVVGLCNGLAYMVLIYNFWNISGGHLNPAVTWGAMITRRIGFFKGIGYILAQILGGVIGALLVESTTPSIYQLASIGDTWNPTVSLWNGFLLETVVTFIFIHTFFSAAFDPISMGRVAPISIGFALTFGTFLTWASTGATTNPARAFGVAVATGNWHHQWVYWVAPLAGSTLASLIYLLLFMTRNVEGALGYHHHPDGVKLVTEAPGAVTERTRLIPTGNAHV
eukprot:TRINITY_DN568_c0_g1_i1.p1 TRINITY_DN568_c0_g1~~TRINITY_DN568_c0_g1_i1.p1  ORF type:complete len:298 (+),score=53.26 TRINITY_DN568_c0_g1_i1:187-1080(+)